MSNIHASIDTVFVLLFFFWDMNCSKLPMVILVFALYSSMAVLSNSITQSPTVIVAFVSLLM